MNVFLSMALLTTIIIVAISFVFIILIPLANTMAALSEIKDAENILNSIDKNIKEVVRSGPGSTRIFRFSNSPKIQTIKEEDIIQYNKYIDSNVFEYLTRKFVDKIAFIAGSDTNCYEGDANNDGVTDIIVENNYIKVAFKKVAKTNPLSNIDTKDNIILINEKTYDSIIYPTNTSIVLDENMQTSYGTGYSELISLDRNSPMCNVHFYINSISGIKYDIFYKLYAGADFIVVDIRNVQ